MKRFSLHNRIMILSAACLALAAVAGACFGIGEAYARYRNEHSALMVYEGEAADIRVATPTDGSAAAEALANQEEEWYVMQMSGSTYIGANETCTWYSGGGVTSAELCIEFEYLTAEGEYQAYTGNALTYTQTDESGVTAITVTNTGDAAAGTYRMVLTQVFTQTGTEVSLQTTQVPFFVYYQ